MKSKKILFFSLTFLLILLMSLAVSAITTSTLERVWQFSGTMVDNVTDATWNNAFSYITAGGGLNGLAGNGTTNTQVTIPPNMKGTTWTLVWWMMDTTGSGAGNGIFRTHDGSQGMAVRNYPTKFDYYDGAGYRDVAVSKTNGKWHMYSMIVGGGNINFYQNTTLLATNAHGNLNTGYATIDMSGTGGWNYAFDAIDEIMFFNNTLTSDNITDLYNAGAGLFYPFVESGDAGNAVIINWTSPLNNTQYNVFAINFTVSVNGTFPINLTLWENGISIVNLTNIADNSFQTIQVNYTASGAYDYYFTGTNNVSNSSVANRTIYIDQVFPTINSTNMVNHFATFGNVINATFNFTDDFILFGYKVFVDGNLHDSKSELLVQSYLYNFSLLTNNLSKGVHTLTINVSDGHTKNKIDDWKNSKDVIKNSVKFEFKKDFVEVYPTGIWSKFEEFKTEKKIDRYSFTHIRGSNRAEETYRVHSSKKITIVNRDDMYKGWLIVGDLNKWIDFETFGNPTDVVATRIDNFTVDITVRNSNSKDLTFNSIGELNTVTATYTFFVGNVTTQYTTPVSEASLTSFKANFDFNSSFISDIYARLNWNGTYYSATQTNFSNSMNFTVNIFVPLVNETQVIPLFWNYTIYGVNNTEINLTETKNQTILHALLSACEYNSSNVTITLVPLDEVSDLPIDNATVEITIEFWSNESARINQSFTFTGQQNYSVCLNIQNLTYRSDAIISYQKDLYDQRNYFFRKYVLNASNPTTIPLYLSNDSLTTDTTIRVTDNRDDPYNEVYVKVLRYFVGTNSYKLVEVVKTNTEGRGISRLVLNDIFYKFIVDDDNATIYTSQNQKVLTNSLNLVITEGSITDKLRKIQALSYSLTYNNDTGNFIFFYSDADNIVRYGCLEVLEKKATGDVVVCDTCQTTATATISCAVDPAKNAMFIASGYIDTNTVNSWNPIVILEVNHIFDFKSFGFMGLFVTILIVTMAAGIGLWKPSAAIIFGIVAIIAASIMGLIGFSYATVIGIVAIGILYLVLVRD